MRRRDNPSAAPRAMAGDRFGHRSTQRGARIRSHSVDGLFQRFAADPRLLTAWETASNVVTVTLARPVADDEGPPAESEVKPAA